MSMTFLKGLSHTQRLLSSEPLEAVVVWTSCPGRCPSDPSPLSLASLQRWVKFPFQILVLDACHITRRNLHFSRTRCTSYTNSISCYISKLPPSTQNLPNSVAWSTSRTCFPFTELTQVHGTCCTIPNSNKTSTPEAKLSSWRGPNLRNEKHEDGQVRT